MSPVAISGEAKCVERGGVRRVLVCAHKEEDAHDVCLLILCTPAAGAGEMREKGASIACQTVGETDYLRKG